MEVALITGASMGIGEEFARQLAERGENLLLVARSEDRLQAIAAELSQRHRVEARIFACDLSKPGAAAEVVAHLEKEQLRVRWLVNNAGFGDVGLFENTTPERVHDMIMVNIMALTELTRLLIPAMKSVVNPRIINVGSIAGFQPIPWFAEYAATKAYVLSLSEALHEELWPVGFRVTCLCPGPVPTNFGKTANTNPNIDKRSQTPFEVVQMALEASDRRRALSVTTGKVLIFLMRFAPRFLVRKIAGMIGKKFVKE